MGKFILMLGFVLPNGTMEPNDKMGDFPTYESCKMAQVDFIRENREIVLDGRVVAICEPK